MGSLAENTTFTLDNMGRFLCNTLQEVTACAEACNTVTGVKLYPSFGEAQLSIGIGAAEKSGDQHARSEMEGLLNELS